MLLGDLQTYQNEEEDNYRSKSQPKKRNIYYKDLNNKLNRNYVSNKKTYNQVTPKSVRFDRAKIITFLKEEEVIIIKDTYTPKSSKEGILKMVNRFRA